jgi:hypothetical protein
MTAHPKLNPTRRLMARAVLCALLLTQALGLMHRVVHAHGPEPVGHAHVAPEPDAAQPHTLEGLFSQHQDAQDCQLFDQLTQADATAFAVPADVAQALAALRGGSCAAPDVAAQAAGYLARGPPALA